MHNTAQNLFAFHTFKIKSWRSSPVNSPGSDCETCCFVAKDSNVRFDALTQVEETRAILHGRPVRGNLQRFDRYQIERLESLGKRLIKFGLLLSAIVYHLSGSKQCTNITTFKTEFGTAIFDYSK